MSTRPKLPDSFMRTPVALYLPIPINNPQGGFGFPAVEVTILEDHGAFLVVQEKSAALPSLWPWERIQKIERVSDLALPPKPLLIRN